MARILKKDEVNDEHVYKIGETVRRERKSSKDEPISLGATAPSPPIEAYKGIASELAEEHMPSENVGGGGSPTKMRSGSKDDVIVAHNGPSKPPTKEDWLAPQGTGWAPAGWGASSDAYPVDDAHADQKEEASAGGVQEEDALAQMRPSAGSGSLRMLEEALRNERKRNIVVESKISFYEQENRKLREAERAAAVEAAALKAKLEAVEASLAKAEKQRDEMQAALLARK